MKILCPKCRVYADVVRSDEPKATRCGACFHDLEEADLVNGAQGTPRTRAYADVAAPSTLTVARDGKDGPLVVVRRWDWLMPLTILLGCIAGDVVLLFFAPLGNPAGRFAMTAAMTIGGLAYGAYALNRTVFTVTDETLSVRHGPLPWPGSVTLDARTLRQLYVRHTDESRSRGTANANRLIAIHADGSETVLDELPRHAAPMVLERLIEERLHLPCGVVHKEAEIVAKDVVN